MEDISRKIESLLSDEESMRQIQELAAMFSGGEFSGTDNADNTEDPADTGSPGGLGIDPFALIQVLNAASAKDKNCELLSALRPHLSEEKQLRIDKAVKLLKLYNIFTVLRKNGLLNDLENIL